VSHVIESVTVEIDAPAALVWEVMTDYARYPEWNSFTVQVETTLRIGEPIDLHLPMPDGSEGTFVNREFIRVVEPPTYLRYDTGEQLPGIFAFREQFISPVGPDRCTYRTTDTFSGEHADAVIEATGDWVKAGFDSVANALKARAEHIHTRRSGTAATS
jgi:uncharacterized protein YndB with AHSA1/START domain